MQQKPKVSESNPFRSSKSPPSLKKMEKQKERHVNVGVEGETPKKIIAYDPSNRLVFSEAIENITESGEDADREESTDEYAAGARNAASELDNSRPKTSRGKSHPSPDEFYNYVVPSPDTGRIKGNRIVLHKASARNGKSENETNEETNNSGGYSIISDNYLLGIDLQGVSRDKQIALLGCWLLGSALRI